MKTQSQFQFTKTSHSGFTSQTPYKRSNLHGTQISGNRHWIQENSPFLMCFKMNRLLNPNLLDTYSTTKEQNIVLIRLKCADLCNPSIAIWIYRKVTCNSKVNVKNCKVEKSININLFYNLVKKKYLFVVLLLKRTPKCKLNLVD